MEPPAPEPDAEAPKRPASRESPPAAARAKSAGPSPQRSDEPKRRRPTAAERRFAGFGDEIERAWCAARDHRLPPDFPVHRRQGIATLAMRPVARRPEAILLCDSAHAGPHRWPDGDEPTDAERAAASAG